MAAIVSPGRTFPVDTLWSRTPQEDHVEAAVKQVRVMPCVVDEQAPCIYPKSVVVYCHVAPLGDLQEHCKSYVLAAS
jgi:HrpA-like RNA helicase